jgi:hypothetical protein
MTSRDISPLFAAALLVCLGLGLIYLYAMDRITAWLVFAILLGGAAGLAALAAVRHWRADAAGR